MIHAMLLDCASYWGGVVEKLPMGGIAALLGISLVFIILGLLIGCIYLMRFLIELSERGKKKGVISAVPQPEPVVADGQEDPKVVAAITAAIFMMLESEQSAGGSEEPRVDFVIRKIKRVR